jgi:hypothetical protein
MSSAMRKLSSLSIDNKDGQTITIMINGEWINPKDIVSMDIHIEPGRVEVSTQKKALYSL